MIKVLYCIQKPDELDSREFDRYWSEETQLVKYFGRSLNACRGVYNRTILSQVNDAYRRVRPGMAAPYQGIFELWWKSQQDFEWGMNTAEARAATERLLEDEKRLVDYSRSQLVVAEEQLLF